jgi:hypothetical protein
MDTCISLFQKEQEDRALRTYITECMRHISENTAKTASALLGENAEAKYMSVSFEDIIHPKPQDKRTPEEIILKMKEKIKKIGGEAN